MCSYGGVREEGGDPALQTGHIHAGRGGGCLRGRYLSGRTQVQIQTLTYFLHTGGSETCLITLDVPDKDSKPVEIDQNAGSES